MNSTLLGFPGVTTIHKHSPYNLKFRVKVKFFFSHDNISDDADSDFALWMVISFMYSLFPLFSPSLSV